MSKIVSKIEATLHEVIGDGEGRNSTVWRAVENLNQREIALKEVCVTRSRPIEDINREAMIVSASHHARVVPVHYIASSDDGKKIRLAMPYMSKGSLQPLIGSKPMPLTKVIKASREFLEGLHHIHIKDIVHFDVKPTNILLHDAGYAMLTDFGQSRQVSDDGLTPWPGLYRPGMPPEYFSQSVGDKLADVYQSGVTIYRLVNGDPCFQEQLNTLWENGGQAALYAAIEKGRFPKRELFLPHVPKRLKTVLRKALHTDPTRRQQSASELRDELGQVSVRYDWDLSVNSSEKLEWVARGQDRDHFISLTETAKGFEITGGIRRQDGSIRRDSDWCRRAVAKKADASRELTKIFEQTNA